MRIHASLPPLARISPSRIWPTVIESPGIATAGVGDPAWACPQTGSARKTPQATSKGIFAHFMVWISPGDVINYITGCASERGLSITPPAAHSALPGGFLDCNFQYVFLDV